MRPVIGIVSDRKVVELDLWDKVTTTYAEFIYDNGGLPIGLPNIPEAFDDYIKLVNGILLPGSTCDIDPSIYGEINTHCHSTLRWKDELEIKFVKYCIAHDMPLLGICRGYQIINVSLGGSLNQDIKTNINILI